MISRVATVCPSEASPSADNSHAPDEPAGSLREERGTEDQGHVVGRLWNSESGKKDA